MIKYVYGSKNKLSGNFNMPILQDFPKDAAVEAYAISVKENPTEQVKELEIYYLGTFDTKTGKFEQSEMEYILDCGSVLSDGKGEGN